MANLPNHIVPQAPSPLVAEVQVLREQMKEFCESMLTAFGVFADRQMNWEADVEKQIDKSSQYTAKKLEDVQTLLNKHLVEMKELLSEATKSVKDYTAVRHQAMKDFINEAATSVKEYVFNDLQDHKEFLVKELEAIKNDLSSKSTLGIQKARSVGSPEPKMGSSKDSVISLDDSSDEEFQQKPKLKRKVNSSDEDNSLENLERKLFQKTYTILPKKKKEALSSEDDEKPQTRRGGRKPGSRNKTKSKVDVVKENEKMAKELAALKSKK